MKPWQFDKKLSLIYDTHVLQHIPFYNKTVDWSLAWADNNLPKSASILDFGCATGSTLRRFYKLGFSNLWGVDSSKDMWNSFQDGIINYSENLIPQRYNLILCNWTLHFNKNKWDLLDILIKSSDALILSEKCIQTEKQKQLYWQWKKSQGLTDNEILEKSLSLEGKMWLSHPSEYPGTIIHHKHEFYTWFIKCDE